MQTKKGQLHIFLRNTILQVKCKKQNAVFAVPLCGLGSIYACVGGGERVRADKTRTPDTFPISIQSLSVGCVLPPPPPKVPP